ncbi:MAG: TolB family protein, partial [Vicinamibacterales bacterium]
MKRLALILALGGLGLTGLQARQAAEPSIDALIELGRVGSPAVSPDGRLVAYTVRRPDWDEDEYRTEIWLGGGDEPARQLTRGPKSSSQPAWSPDGKWLGFVSDRSGESQVYRLAVDGGEAERLTDTETGVNRFAWSPDGRRLAYTMTDPVSEAVKERKKTYG